MEYIGESLVPGRLGHLFIVLSFVASLLAIAGYVFAVQRRDRPEMRGWLNIGRLGFLLHGFSVLAIIGALFYILVEKRYEYHYAWANVSDDLPFKYTFSAFWKEQQGSFLLWSFWHIALGLIVMVRGGRWEAPVLAVVSLAEAFIASMILGLYFGDFRLGASPFDLLREVMDAPIFMQADYLSKISGNGLNPLLQNYWMTIHPPTLFLGFASTLFPFSYAIAGLWTREHREWLQPALRWALFSGAILGLGILMGGAWAYEALTFGGYWAWDPVENTSLVPWITLVAGIHTNLVARSTGYSIRSTYGFYLLTFILILYSTYLTRSGILGDTSAHAFTEMGLGMQLILYIGVFSLLGGWLWGSRYRGVPQDKKEETTDSREFWMFIGSLVLLFSAVLITGATSLPVWNKIVQSFDPEYVGAALKDPLDHHNRYQLWIGVLISMLSGTALFLRYGERNWKGNAPRFYKYLLFSVGAASALTVLLAFWIEARAWQYVLLLFAGNFAIACNLFYLFGAMRGRIKLAASALSHFGFGVLVLGILASGLNKSYLSSNSFAMEGLIEGADENAINRNILLLKDAPMPMRDGYEAVYLGDTIERQTRTFKIRFQKRDSLGNATGESFVLTPNVMYDRPMKKVVATNPSTQHYLHRDIFTHIVSLPKAELDPEFAKQQEDSLKFVKYEGAIGDTIYTQEHYLVVEGITKSPAHPEYKPKAGDLAYGVHIAVHSLEDTAVHRAMPMIYIRPGEGGFQLPAVVNPLSMRIRLSEASIGRIFETEDSLRYTPFQIKEGDAFEFNEYKIRFAAVEREIKHPLYTPEPEDIAVGATLEVVAPDGKTATATPVFLIRGNQPYSLKDEVLPMGLHFRFDKVDPRSGLLTISAAQSKTWQRRIPLEVAENAPRADYVVLEAILFPGINLVWLGSLTMLFGLALALVVRLRSKVEGGVKCGCWIRGGNRKGERRSKSIRISRKKLGKNKKSAR